MSRIAGVFDKLRAKNRAAFIPFIMAGDPDADISLEILKGLPSAGADIIELGVAFTDPMADGPSVQAAGLRALQAGQTLSKTLDLVRAFRRENDTTPIVLMGYFNPIHHRGAEKFAAEASAAGVDGLIVVDAPPEEDGPLRAAAGREGLDVIRLATPTTDDARGRIVTDGASGFLYYVSVAGVTGAASARVEDVAHAISQLKKGSELPVALGFGVKTPAQAEAFAKAADAVVVGSAIVDQIRDTLEKDGAESNNIVHTVLSFASDIANAVHHAR